MNCKPANNNLKLPPRFSMEEYADAVEFLLSGKKTEHVRKQKAMEEHIRTPFALSPQTTA